MDAVLHVFSRGVDKQDIFRSDGDRRCFLALVNHHFRLQKVSLFAYCLMGNHFHLLLSPSKGPLGIAMHHVLTRYSLYFNHQHVRVGHLFQNRFKAKICANDAYLIHLIAYIHLNPVRAGLVQTPSVWPWSSHAAFVAGGGKHLDLVRLSHLSGIPRAELAQSYLNRVEELEKRPGDQETALDVLLERAAHCIGVLPIDLSNGTRGELFTKARRLFVHWASQEGYGLGRIAQALNCTKGAVSQLHRGYS